jgi:hypothetical protein
MKNQKPATLTTAVTTVHRFISGALRSSMKRNGETKSRLIQYCALTVAGASLFAFNAHAGTYKHITIDGSFGDWAGVPVAYSSAQNIAGNINYKDIYIANDDDYIYVRFTTFAPPNTPWTWQQNYFFNADNDPTTGYSSHGVGSEMLVQSGAGYQEKAGIFNAGGITGLDWAAAPAGPANEFEFRVSRHATNTTGGTPVFTDPNGFSITLESDAGTKEYCPPTGGGVAYTYASAPADLTGSLPLVSLNSTWTVDASGTDNGTNWLDPNFYDGGWASGNGLFGYTPAPGSYPTIQTPLSAGPNTYYFRTHFNWNNNAANVAFVLTNYLSDGAVYYMNGVEVKRVRMPAGNVAYGTAASGNNSPVGHADVLGIDGGTLIIGDNVLEVEAHQAPASSADMVFGASLTAASQFPVTIGDATLPADVSLISGQSATFTADVFGSGPLSYQWLRSGTNIVGATNSTLTIPTVLAADAGTYSLHVSNSGSSVTTRAATLTVLGTPVVITDPSQPVNQIVVAGHPATFTVAASGSAPLQYQWYVGANAISDATNVSYTIPFVVPTNAGTYHVLVTNPVNSTNSRNATLTVVPDTIAPAVTAITAGGAQIIITFSEPVDPASAGNVANYSVGGATVTGATLNGNSVTLTLNSPLTIGALQSLRINGVTDLFGNTTHSTVSFAPSIVIDGDVSDWAGIPPVYSGPSGVDGAADVKDLYVYNDANYYYFRVTLWHDVTSGGQFPDFCNVYYDTDGTVATGYPVSTAGPNFGSELLMQSGFFYQEKNGAFNDNVAPVGLDYAMAPNVPAVTFPADFEWRISRQATFGGGGLIFSTNTVSVAFQGQSSAWSFLNWAPASGSTATYTNVASVVVPPLPLGQVSMTPLGNGNLAITWDGTATLQASSGPLANNSWTNVPAAVSPYVVPAAGTQQYFRLKQ